MADKKPGEFVDTIGDATRQRRYAVVSPVKAAPAPAQERSRLSNWPRQRQIRWRLETLMPWRIKPWLRND